MRTLLICLFGGLALNLLAQQPVARPVPASKVPAEQKLQLEKATNEMLRAQINILVTGFKQQCDKQGLVLGPDPNGDLDCVAKPPVPEPEKKKDDKKEDEKKKKP